MSSDILLCFLGSVILVPQSSIDLEGRHEESEALSLRKNLHADMPTFSYTYLMTCTEVPIRLGYGGYPELRYASIAGVHDVCRLAEPHVPHQLALTITLCIPC